MRKLTNLGSIQLSFIKQKSGLWKIVVVDRFGFGKEVLSFYLPQQALPLENLDQIVRFRLKRLGFDYTYASHLYGLYEKD
mgnify:CR=1 FL=1